MVLFFGIFLTVVGSSHYYLWARLVRDCQLPAPLHVALTFLFALLPLSILLALVSARSHAPPLSRWLMLAIYFWMGTCFCLLWVQGGASLLTTLAFRFNFLSPMLDPARRLFLARASGLLTVGVAGGLSLQAALTARRGPVVERVSIELARFPQSLSGLRVVQLSDLHVANLLGRDYVEHVVAEVKALSPDLIVLTGDLVDGSVAQLSEAIAPLRELSARYGVFVVTGNHEYYSGVDAWLAHYQALGMRVLRNERVSIGEPGASFDLVGIDDATASHFGPGHGADLPKALLGRDETRECVLLAHQPKQVFEAEKLGVGLMLSGHTHGGQIFPFGLLVRLAQPFVRGLHRQGRTQIYVNRGTGYWGPPMRLGSQPEITLLSLQAPSGAPT